MKTRTIRQTITLDASPHDVYEMLMDEMKHARFTGGAAQISRDVGGAFFTNNGYSTGTNKELVQDTRIVQTWRAGDWPQGSLFPADGHPLVGLIKDEAFLGADRSS